ncbi:MAG: DUF2059 domain-containing protein [Cyanobacteria bacterium SZAS LIN-2]|nr:DUF2059 domain-containing protein [Cyanobacteria bacterium SZAS LIN-2]MBS2006490.1 DUF2059 domain-containing protein [Cyanobacteria bacterium SZAS TMP-1]
MSSLREPHRKQEVAPILSALVLLIAGASGGFAQSPAKQPAEPRYQMSGQTGPMPGPSEEEAAHALESIKGKGTAASSTTAIDPAKKAAIKELVELTKMHEQVGAVRDLMINQSRRTVDNLVAKKINSDASIPEERKQAMLDELSDSSDRIINRYLTLSKERINMAAMMEQVAYKVYDQCFTTSEIQDIIAFYRTPTGQKTLREMPQIVQRTIVASTEALQSQIFDVVKEVSDEELVRLKKGSPLASPQTDAQKAKKYNRE